MMQCPEGDYSAIKCAWSKTHLHALCYSQTEIWLIVSARRATKKEKVASTEKAITEDKS